MRYEPTLEFAKAQADVFTLGEVTRKRLVKEIGK